ncbi:MAG TPA: SDR family NAD(P)-dependent oxidoreductase, partial [Burkholderiales bacterium]
MDLQLKGKKVLVTGGSKGIGLACAKAFIAEGARVAIVSRSQANLDAAKKILKECFCISGDLADATAAASIVEKVEAEFGPLDVLVNSAGAARRTNADELNPAAWRAAMDAKYFTYINVMDPL